MLLLSILYLCFLGVLFNALEYHFEHLHVEKLGQFREIIMTIAVASLYSAYHILFNHQQSQGATSNITSLIAFVFYIASLSLYYWTWTTTSPSNLPGNGRLAIIFARTKPKYVLSTGPFAYLRHPTYASYFLGWLAVVIHTRSLFLVALLAAMAGFFESAARLEERQFMGPNVDEKVAKEYDTYRRQTGKWIPKHLLWI